MEENIKRVEKLVHATNSALAQMKFSLMFDDISGEEKERTSRPEGLNRMLVDKFLNEDDLTQCQKEFQLEANKMLTKVEEMFSSNESNRKKSKVIDRIKEINNEVNSLKLEQSKPDETEQSRQKLLSLINEKKFSPGGMSSSKRSVCSKPTNSINREKESSFVEKAQAVPWKNDFHFSVTKSPDKSKMELKNKILETQEIVDRGFLTAKQLAQKVDSMTKLDRKERTPSTCKTPCENNLTTSSAKKTDSNVTVKSYDDSKRRRHSEREKKRDEIVREVEQVNTQVIDVKRKERQRRAVTSNLQLQRLPSVHIRGGLKMQRVHNLEIPANEDTATACERPNTAISFLSHEQMENKKMEKMVEKVKRENCYCTEDSTHRVNYIECFHCGKLNKVRDAWKDPREIDEILHQCNYNVFDPRIDEYAEKFGKVDVRKCSEMSQPPKTLQSNVSIREERKFKSKKVDERIETKHRSEEPIKKSRDFTTLGEFSNEIFKKYKEEIKTLEDNHLKLDSILQSLFSKVDESRKLFEDCHFLKNLSAGSEKAPHLTYTKPIVVTLSGGGSFQNRKRQRKFHKKSTDKRTKTKAEPYSSSSSPELPETKNKSEGILQMIQLNQSGKDESNATELQGRFSRLNEQTQTAGKKEETEEKPATSVSASKSQNTKPEMSVRKNSEKTSATASVQSKTAKSQDGICREVKMLNRLFPTKLSDSRREQLEEEKVPNVAVSVPSNKTSGISREDMSSPQGTKDVVNKDNVELVSPSGNKSNSEAEEETTSEKSENIYESDFESEPEEKENGCEEQEEEELEVIEGLKKLSTISEVESDLEKRLSDEQKTTKSSHFDVDEDDDDDSCKSFRMSIAELGKKEEDKSVVSERKTAASEASLKSTPTELATSLKDILSTLQDQFAKTETLAEKLTDNAKMKRKEEKAEPALGMSDVWKMADPGKLVENLQSARKNWNRVPKLYSLPEKDLLADSSSDEGGSSLGEIIISDRRRLNLAGSDNNSVSEGNFLNSDSARRCGSGRRETNSPFGLSLLN